MTRSYQLEDAPERAMQWEAYEKLILAEWGALLNRSPAPGEREVQAFFEKHPSMVPGAHNITGNESGHYPWLCGLISQPPLPSYDRHIPDFMWLSINSDTEEPVLVEIEDPSKRWFTEFGAQTAELTQALNQIAEWKAWFGVPHNVQAFKALYRLDREAWRRRRFRPAYLLIYGRRAEANATPERTERRAHLQPEHTVVMTYDRLQPNAKAREFVCLKVDSAGELRAISVPPTLTWRPGLAEERSLVRDLDKAIEANRHLSAERKAFLVRRLPYWNDYVSRTRAGITFSNAADEE
jgi:hypothetical protein